MLIIAHEKSVYRSTAKYAFIVNMCTLKSIFMAEAYNLHAATMKTTITKTTAIKITTMIATSSKLGIT